MEDYAGRILAERYRLPLPPSDEYELIETRAFDTRSGQEVLVRQVPLPEVVDAELLDGTRGGPAAAGGRRTAAAELPAVRRAIAAAQAAASVPDHPRLDQVFDVFAEGGSLWIVSELVPARPLAALIAEEPLSPYRAAEVAADVLTALRVLHAHGWTHRNITMRTVLICEDGRVVLTGLAAGAAEDALCGYDPVPSPEGTDHPSATPPGWAVRGTDTGPALGTGTGTGGPSAAGYDSGYGSGYGQGPGPDPGTGSGQVDRYGTAPAAGPGGASGWDAGDAAEPEARGAGPGPAAQGAGYAPIVAPGYDTGPRYNDHIATGAAGASGATESAAEQPDLKSAARAGAIAAYRAGAQAAARITEQRKAGAESAPDPERTPAEPRPEGSTLPKGYSYPYGGPDSGATWHGATPRRQALPPGEAEPQTPPTRAALPAQLALPQGYHQADAPGGGAPSPSGPGQGSATGPQPPAERGHTRPGEGRIPEGPPPAEAPAQAHPRPGAQYRALPDSGGAQYRAPANGGAQYQALPNGDGAQYQALPGSSRALPDTQALPDTRALPNSGGPGPGSSSGPGPGPGPVPGQERAPGDAGWAAAEGGRAAGDGVRPADTGVRPADTGVRAGWGSGPRSGLDAERARQTRMAVVGAVTERWAPEQAQAVHGPWQLAAPVGPATDLWGLGALLYRAVQGHAPYPEDSVAELVEMVCAEPPAFAEECGPLRPVVESLLRQDPTERPDFEELRGWLRSLVRSAPEPDGGFTGLLPMPEPDPARLPVVRRRADLHGRHRSAEHPRKPRSLGRSLLLGVMVLLAGSVAYAMFFMPRSADPQGGGQKAAGMGQPAATHPPSPGRSPKPSGSGPAPSPSASPPESRPATQTAAPAPPGYTAQQDAEHFQINVPNGWDRRGMNESGQVRYTEGEFALTVVPGRDKAEGNPDPATYQKDKEPELAPYRSSTWSSVSDIKSTKVGNQLRVTGRYTWIDGNGRSVVARNFVVALGGSYHIVLVTGPVDEEGKVTEVFEQATASYKNGG